MRGWRTLSALCWRQKWFSNLRKCKGAALVCPCTETKAELIICSGVLAHTAGDCRQRFDSRRLSVWLRQHCDQRGDRIFEPVVWVGCAGRGLGCGMRAGGLYCWMRRGGNCCRLSGEEKRAGALRL